MENTCTNQEAYETLSTSNILSNTYQTIQPDQLKTNWNRIIVLRFRCGKNRENSRRVRKLTIVLRKIGLDTRLHFHSAIRFSSFDYNRNCMFITMRHQFGLDLSKFRMNLEWLIYDIVVQPRPAKIYSKWSAAYHKNYLICNNDKL